MSCRDARGVKPETHSEHHFLQESTMTGGKNVFEAWTYFLFCNSLSAERWNSCTNTIFHLQRCFLWLCKMILKLRMAKLSSLLLCSSVMFLSKCTKMYFLISPDSHISQTVLLWMSAHPYSSLLHLQEPEQNCPVSESTSPESGRRGAVADYKVCFIWEHLFLR